LKGLGRAGTGFAKQNSSRFRTIRGNTRSGTEPALSLL
jgi:hypothetical protein